MKTLLAGVAALLFSAAVRAQDATAVALSQREAIREFPDLSEAKSDFNRRFLGRITSLRAGHDSLLLRDDWPVLVAKQVGLELGLDPILPQKPVVKAAAPKPTPTPVPWVPGTTMLDAKPGDKAETDQDESGKKYLVYGNVLQRTQDGLLVECQKPRSLGYPAATGQVWLEGKDVSQGATVKAVAKKIGTRSFPKYTGSSQLLDVYKAQ